MKKTVIAISSIALAGAIVSGAFAASGAYEKKNAISSQSAIEIALADAGIKAADAQNTSAILDREGIHYVFDVEFDSDKNEYDYTINAKTGEVIERDIEPRDDDKTAALTQAAIQVKKTESGTENKTEKKTEKASATSAVSTSASSTQKNADIITLEKAKSIALADAKLDEKSVKFTKAKLDRDDGVKEYEIEFISNGKEYEYSINANSGKIVDKDIEAAEKTAAQIKTTAQNKTKATSSANISIEKAKEIALNHAGLSANDVRFEKVILEKDDGIYEYEIEFSKGRTEYEYSINAKTGAIIEYDIDND